MPIPTFPIAFPMNGVFTECDLQPKRRQAAGVLQSGTDLVIDRGYPQWTGTWKTRTLNALEIGAWDAWARSLRGAERTFLGYDPVREYPLSYMPQGYGGSLAGVIISGISSARDEVSLANVPTGFEMVNGDYLSIAYGSGLVHLTSLLSSATADGSENLGPLWVEPELPNLIGLEAAVGIIRPCAKWRLTKYSSPKSGDGGLRLGSVSFEAVSVSI